MTTSLNPDIITAIAEKLANQILAFQSFIAARPEGQQFPTLQEANQQHKLITCLLRLTKQPAKGSNKKLTEPEDLQALNTWSKAVAEMLADDGAPGATTHEPQSKRASTVVTQRDFEQYGHQLGKNTFANLTEKTTIRFNGRYVNAMWLQYNLSQYLLPIEQRHFIDDARDVIAQVDRSALSDKMNALLADRKKMAA